MQSRRKRNHQHNSVAGTRILQTTTSPAFLIAQVVASAAIVSLPVNASARRVTTLTLTADAIRYTRGTVLAASATHQTQAYAGRATGTTTTTTACRTVQVVASAVIVSHLDNATVDGATR